MLNEIFAGYFKLPKMSIKNAFSSVADPEHLAESRSELTVSGSTSLMNRYGSVIFKKYFKNLKTVKVKKNFNNNVKKNT